VALVVVLVLVFVLALVLAPVPVQGSSASHWDDHPCPWVF